MLLPDNLPEVAAARERGILIAERIGRGALLLPPVLGRLWAGGPAWPNLCVHPLLQRCCAIHFLALCGTALVHASAILFAPLMS